MNYLLLSRTIYALPFLIYCALHAEELILNPSVLPFSAMWGVVFLFSIFFYAISRKVLPLLLVQFVFLMETFLFAQMALNTGYEQILLFIILSSFYTIESLRNNTYNILAHLLLQFGSFYAIQVIYGMSPVNLTYSKETLFILISPIICRAIMSCVDERDVIFRETVIKSKVPVKVEVEKPEQREEIDKLKRKLVFFKGRTKDVSRELEDVKTSNERLQTDFERIKTRFEKLYKENQTYQQINSDVAQNYFLLIANAQYDSTRTTEENLENIFRIFIEINESLYTALIIKDVEHVDDEEEYSLALNNSFSPNGVKFNDKAVIENDAIYERIIDTIDNNQVSSMQVEDAAIDPLKNVLFVPISEQGNVRGILIQAFDGSYGSNIHNFNYSLIVAHYIYEVLEKEPKNSNRRNENVGIEEEEQN